MNSPSGVENEISRVRVVDLYAAPAVDPSPNAIEYRFKPVSA